MLGRLIQGQRASERENLPLGLDDWANMFSAFQYGGVTYPFVQYSGTTAGNREEIGQGFAAYTQGAYRSNGVVFACMLLRLSVFCQARFLWRRLGKSGRPGDMFGTPELDLLQHPWANATTADLLARAIQDVDLAGNFFCLRRKSPGDPPYGHLRRLRPDWVTIVAGSPRDANVTLDSVDAELIGYLYHPRGPYADSKPVVLMPEEVCHFAPIPDPLFVFRGMSWLQPIIREVMADGAATTHKLKFFENGAQPGFAVSLDPQVTKQQFDLWKEEFNKTHSGLANAYRTLFMGGGATITPVGNSFRQMDFKVTQGAGETRVAAAAGCPPILVGLSEGLESGTYCLPFNGSVWTAEGPRAIGAVRPGDRVWAWETDGLHARRVTRQSCTGAAPILTLRTKNRTFRGTGSHPLLMRDGSWKRLDQVQIGDLVKEPIDFPDIGGERLPSGQIADAELMRWLGAFIGDGCVSGGDVYMCIPKQDRVRAYYEALPPRLFTKHRNGQYVNPGRRAKDGLTEQMVELRDRGLTFKAIGQEMGVALHPMSIRDRVDVATREYVGEREPVEIREGHNGFRFGSTEAVAWHRAMGVCGGAREKRIPGWVFTLTQELRLEFLAGIVDTDGSVGRDGRLQIAFASQGLVEDVRMLLISCGIQCCNIHESSFPASGLPNLGRRESYQAWGFTASSARDAARIPFADALYRERVEANQGRHRPNREGWFRVRSVMQGEAEPVYDIEVASEAHSFLSDGIVVHNSNYGQAVRRFGDGTMTTLWSNFAGSMQHLLANPGGAYLAADARDIAFLRADQQDEAEIRQIQATTINTLITAGYKPDAVIPAVIGGDFSALVGQHTNLFSVQLQPPGELGEPGGPTTAPAVPAPANGNGSGAPTAKEIAKQLVKLQKRQ